MAAPDKRLDIAADYDFGGALKAMDNLAPGARYGFSLSGLQKGPVKYDHSDTLMYRKAGVKHIDESESSFPTEGLYYELSVTCGKYMNTNMSADDLQVFLTKECSDQIIMEKARELSTGREIIDGYVSVTKGHPNWRPSPHCENKQDIPCF